jgi:hypothetical protein
MDWVAWHNGYDTWPPLRARLRAVREQLAALDACPAGPVRIISLCAGDGGELIGLLHEHPRRDSVRAYLVEQNADLVRQGEAALAQFRLVSVIAFRHADATLSTTYLDIAPADIVLAAGVFGNLTPPQTARLVSHFLRLCRPEGAVIWTRRVGRPEHTQAVATIREGLEVASFYERALVETDPIARSSPCRPLLTRRSLATYAPLAVGPRWYANARTKHARPPSQHTIPARHLSTTSLPWPGRPALVPSAISISEIAAFVIPGPKNRKRPPEGDRRSR